MLQLLLATHCRGALAALLGVLALTGCSKPPRGDAADGGSVFPDASGCEPSVPTTSSALFVNLQADCYYCRQPTFVDLVKAAECFRAGWTTCRQGRSALTTDQGGWPLETPSGDVARILLGPVHRTGTYVVRWSGKGSFAIAPVIEDDAQAMASPLKVEASGSGETTFEATGQGVIALEISATDAADHLRDFSVIHRDLVARSGCDPFYPELVDYLSMFSGLRMMDWTSTNNSTRVTWKDRVPSYAYSQAERVETAIALCNRVQRDCWLNVPHRADDGYVTQLALLVRDHLDPKLKVYIEYSNETWNAQFEQYEYCLEQGQAANLSGSTPHERGARYYAYRAKQIFTIFDDAFGAEARARVVRVVAGQTGEAWLVDTHLDQLGGSAQLDAYATAPYIGPGSIDGFDGQADSWTLDQLFEHMFDAALPSAIADMGSVAQVVASYQPAISFVAYEGGQHLAGARASDHARALYVQAQTDERMRDLYERYLSGWRASGGRQFALYNALGPINGVTGSWGLKPSLNTPDAQAPKYDAVKRWNASNPSWW